MEQKWGIFVFNLNNVFLASARNVTANASALIGDETVTTITRVDTSANRPIVSGCCVTWSLRDGAVSGSTTIRFLYCCQ